MAIKACIFDWAGTTVDFGCFAPIHAFIKAFKKHGLEPTIEETRQPMGLLKIDHIKAMLENKRLKAQWLDTHLSEPSEEDINSIYQDFERYLLKDLKHYSAPIENVIEVTYELREKGIKIGSTTGYTSKMMDVVYEAAKLKGYNPDYYSTADIAGAGRPSALMIYDNMKYFHFENKMEIIKVGDTIADIQEGNNAGVWSVGIIKGSSLLGLSKEEYEQLTSNRLIDKVRIQYMEAGADFVISEIKELPYLIEFINKRIESGAKPNGNN